MEEFSQEKWDRLKEQLKKEHPELTDEDLRLEPGKEAEVIERLEKKLNKTKKDITDWLHLMG